MTPSKANPDATIVDHAQRTAHGPLSHAPKRTGSDGQAPLQRRKQSRRGSQLPRTAGGAASPIAYRAVDSRAGARPTSATNATSMRWSRDGTWIPRRKRRRESPRHRGRRPGDRYATLPPNARRGVQRFVAPDDLLLIQVGRRIAGTRRARTDDLAECPIDLDAKHACRATAPAAAEHESPESGCRAVMRTSGSAPSTAIGTSADVGRDEQVRGIIDGGGRQFTRSGERPSDRCAWRDGRGSGSRRWRRRTTRRGPRRTSTDRAPSHRTAASRGSAPG